jgi:guanylate kinase
MQLNSDLNRLIVLVGPSGVGKTTLCSRLSTARPGLERIVTSTTRAPRPGEIDGVDYLFMSDAQFDERLAAGDFLEWALVHGKHRYGTLRSAVADRLEHSSLVGILDVQGARSLRDASTRDPRLNGRLVEVFIAADSIDTLRERLEVRGEMGQAEIDRRMKSASFEMEAIPEFRNVILSGTPDEDFAALLDLLPRPRLLLPSPRRLGREPVRH